MVPNDHNVAQPGNDGVSSLTWSPAANILVSSNWDNGVRCWEVQEQSGQIMATPKAQGARKYSLHCMCCVYSLRNTLIFRLLSPLKVNHLKPVLDTCFSPDGTTVFSCGTDNAARMWQLGSAPPQPNNVAQQIGSHDAPIQSIRFLKNTNLVVTGGWDRKLKFWDCRQQQPVGQFDLPERAYAMDAQDGLLVVATAGRHVIAYDVSGQPREHTRKESPLKFQTRCIACFPEATGFAIGSIEGRVGIHYLQKVPGKESFAFKCHRQDSNVYAVNVIAFHVSSRCHTSQSLQQRMNALLTHVCCRF
jgi:mRNA export factor